MSQGGCGKDLRACRCGEKRHRAALDGQPRGLSPHERFRERASYLFGNSLRGPWWRTVVMGPFGKLRAGSSTPHVLSLCESTCSAQDDKSVYGSYVVWKDEYEFADSSCCGAGEDSAAEDFYGGVVGERETVFGGAEGVGEDF